MIYTGNYSNCNIENTVSISGDRGKSVGYIGKEYISLAPKLSFWKEWHENVKNLSDQENNNFYIKEYYKTVLSKLDAKQLVKELKNNILLCYEEPKLFCHRHIVAAWIETELGIFVPEIKIIDGVIFEIEKNNQILNDYKKLIKKTK